MAKRTFREMVTSGSVIASAPVEEAQFQRIITNINEQFRLTLETSKEAFELFRDDIRVVSGRFWHELEAVDRKTVLDRLKGSRRTSGPSGLSCFLSEKGCMRQPIRNWSRWGCTLIREAELAVHRRRRWRATQLRNGLMIAHLGLRRRDRLVKEASAARR